MEKMDKIQVRIKEVLDSEGIIGLEKILDELDKNKKAKVSSTSNSPVVEATPNPTEPTPQTVANPTTVEPKKITKKKK